ncbi:N-acetyltransferase [Microbacterium sp. QXD-8]|uniref:N-acetyltransferase n=1 Tax=Microbacterium psychrotolerans TaxID=3068321 RepID=A0ABU0YVW4_9MICO|nr:N-acetyltransferase [Microbacterium sp. QXD-8]MDQ7876474.1 N-acetyltransferase [Microbacterium sp. QXD-8]
MHADASLIRPEHPGDLEAIRRLHLSAFRDHGRVVNALVGDLRPTIAELGGSSFVAAAAGEIQGHVMVTMSLLDTARRLLPAPVLSPLAVAPEHQGAGLGASLVQHALRSASEADWPFVILEGDPGYYARLGFRPAGGLGFRRPSLRIPDAAFQVVLLPAYEPWMTGTLVYAWPFWAHDAVGLRTDASA